MHILSTCSLANRMVVFIMVDLYPGQAVKPPELNPETEESLPSRRSPEGPDPPVLTEVTPTLPSDSPPDLESVEKKMVQGRYSSVVSVFCCLYISVERKHVCLFAVHLPRDRGVGSIQAKHA